MVPPDALAFEEEVKAAEDLSFCLFMNRDKQL